ncbi:MAG TPA: F0F1 ATP synthase subunit A, partial [Steroidobacteraceae bacterium]|nr:F0F1 ATP synthase subunit A [Steroidobacteraceae bacterium]
MQASPLANIVVFRIGPVAVTAAVVTTWGIMAALTAAAALLERRPADPARPPGLAELLVASILGQIEDVVRADPRPLLPLLGTLFIYLVAANLCGLLPGLHAPTANLETPAALAIMVFCAVHVHGVRAQGLMGYLASFARPKPIMLP